MSNIFKSVLALIGLLAVLSHPVTRQGLDALAELWSKVAVYRVAAVKAPVVAAANGKALAAELKAAEASLSQDGPAAGAEPATTENGEEAPAGSAAVGSVPDEAVTETDKAMGIYKEAEKDTDEEE